MPTSYPVRVKGAYQPGGITSSTTAGGSKQYCICTLVYIPVTDMQASYRLGPGEGDEALFGRMKGLVSKADCARLSRLVRERGNVGEAPRDVLVSRDELSAIHETFSRAIRLRHSRDHSFRVSRQMCPGISW